VIIDPGRVIADGTPAELKTLAGNDVIGVHTREAVELPAAATALRRLTSDEPAVDAATRRVSLSVDDGTKQLAAAVRALEEQGVAVDDIALRRPTLDEIFLALTGQGLKEDTPDSERGRRRAA
jgi:ABC-2 type transport system ATP-binding protein